MPFPQLLVLCWQSRGAPWLVDAPPRFRALLFMGCSPHGYGSVQTSPFYKDTSLLDQGPSTLCLNYICNNPISNKFTF